MGKGKILVVLGILILAGIVYWMMQEDEEATDDSAEETNSESFVLSEQNDSAQNGTVELEEVEGKVLVTITLSNPTSVEEPAHIHEGICPNPGAIVFPLENVVNGTSVTTIDTTLADLEEMGDLAINIHKSAAESSVYYACGDLEL